MGTPINNEPDVKRPQDVLDPATIYEMAQFSLGGRRLTAYVLETDSGIEATYVGGGTAEIPLTDRPMPNGQTPATRVSFEVVLDADSIAEAFRIYDTYVEIMANKVAVEIQEEFKKQVEASQNLITPARQMPKAIDPKELRT